MIVYKELSACEIEPSALLPENDCCAPSINITCEPLSEIQVVWSVASFSKYLYAYAFLEPLGLLPNTSDISFPALGSTDADTAAILEPLILNTDDDICESIDAVEKPTASSPLCVG